MAKRSTRGKYDRTLSARERDVEQRTKLIDAATSVIAKVGFKETTVELIVDRAGMSRRTFYEHFADTRDVLAQIYERAATISMTMVTSSARAHVDPRDALRAGITAYFMAVATYPEVARVMFLEYRQGGRDFEQRYQRDSERYAELLLQLVQMIHATGQLATKPTEATIFAVAKGIEGLAVRAIANAKQDRLHLLVPEIYELVLAPFRRAA